jgi:hypothetical protein
VIIGKLLIGTGGLFVLIGIVLVVLYALNGPPRYGRPVRMDAERPPSRTMRSDHLGAVLICAGATLLLAGVYRLNTTN